MTTSKTTAKKKSTIPATQNTSWGFWGTIAGQEYARPRIQELWNLAMKGLVKKTQRSYGSARAFLDSSHGRHFADALLSNMHLHKTDSIQKCMNRTMAQWNNYTVSPSTIREYGFKEGQTYLQGMLDYHMPTLEKMSSPRHGAHAWESLNEDAQAAISQMCAAFLRIETLETRNSDRLDFHEVGVASLRDALARAYIAGADLF